MQLHRRAMIGLGVAAGIAPAARAQAPAPRPDPAVAITARATEARMRLDFDGSRYSGPAYELLLREAQGAQFFLIGEEHGIAENPRLAAQLFEALAPAGYRHLGIEVSPQMANELDAAARVGVPQLARMYRTPGSATAFFGMREEAEMLTRVRAAGRGPAPVLWGMDYEVAGDRRVIALLEAAPKPPAARAALARLKAAADAGWGRYQQTRNLQDGFSFAGDPALVRQVRAAWPRPDAASLWALDTLEATLEINNLWNQRKGWDSNQRRARLIRANFLRHWRAAGGPAAAPKVMFKMGANHMIRGLNDVGTFDLGSLLPEAAAVSGGRTFSVMVLPGTDSQVAVLDPTTFGYRAASAKDDYANGLDLLGGQAYPDAFTLFDLRKIRPAIGERATAAYPHVARIANGFDALLVMSRSTPSHDL